MAGPRISPAIAHNDMNWYNMVCIKMPVLCRLPLLSGPVTNNWKKGTSNIKVINIIVTEYHSQRFNTYHNVIPGVDTISVYLLYLRTQITKFMGPTWGPPGSCRPHVGPTLAPGTFIRYVKYISVAWKYWCEIWDHPMKFSIVEFLQTV